MNIRSFLIVAGTVLTATSTTQALAAHTLGSVNLRLGPGTSYGVVTIIPVGAPVLVHGCGPNWCSVGYAGFNGWLPATYLSGHSYSYAVYPYAHYAAHAYPSAPCVYSYGEGPADPGVE
jgi:uncharacterized protein YraI